MGAVVDVGEGGSENRCGCAETARPRRGDDVGPGPGAVDGVQEAAAAARLAVEGKGRANGDAIERAYRRGAQSAARKPAHRGGVRREVVVRAESMQRTGVDRQSTDAAFEADVGLGA